MILHPIIDRLKRIADLLPTAIGGEFVPSGTKEISITENGTTTENVTSYANAEITVNVPPSGIIPTGTKQISITENGTTTEDVTNYATAEITVNVPPSGAPLPSNISKIDGGSFTPSSDTASDQISISHNLGVVPKGFVIWTEDEISGAVATRYMSNCYVGAVNIVDKNSTSYIACGAAAIFYNGTASILSNNTLFTTVTVQKYMDAEKILWNSSLIFYKTGITYNWIAWS